MTLTLRALLVLLVASTLAPAQSVLYAVDTFANLYTVDRATAALTFVGPPGIVATAKELTAGPDGRLYMMGSSPGVLYAVDPITGAATIVTTTTIPTGPTFTEVRGLAFDGAGDLYVEILLGSQMFPGQLWRVDPDTGAAVMMGGGPPPFVEGLDWDPATSLFFTCDCNFTASTLYGLTTSGGANTALAVTAAGPVTAIAVDDDGTIWTAGSELRTIDRVTGVSTLVGSFTGTQIVGLAVLEPPAYPGNGSDVAVSITVSGAPQPPSPGRHAVNVTDVVGLGFISPAGSLTLTPFTAFWQLFPSGSPPPRLGPIGLFFDFNLATGLLADGIGAPPQLFNPVLDAWFVSGTVPPSLAGTGSSFLVNCVVTDPLQPPFNFGIADAAELRIN